MSALTRCDVEIAVILFYSSDKAKQILDSLSVLLLRLVSHSWAKYPFTLDNVL